MAFTLVFTPALPFSTSIVWAGGDNSSQPPTGAFIQVTNPAAPGQTSTTTPPVTTSQLPQTDPPPSTLSQPTTTETIKLTDGRIFNYDSNTGTGNVEGAYYTGVKLISSCTDLCTRDSCRRLLCAGIVLSPDEVQIGNFNQTRAVPTQARPTKI